jgi:hypothetical protein
LMLPKGFRKRFLGANPRRYWRRQYPATDDYQSLSGSVDESILLQVEKRRLMDLSLGPSSMMIPSSTLTPSSNTAGNSRQQQPTTGNRSDNNRASFLIL